MLQNVYIIVIIQLIHQITAEYTHVNQAACFEDNKNK